MFTFLLVHYTYWWYLKFWTCWMGFFLRNGQSLGLLLIFLFPSMELELLVPHFLAFLFTCLPGYWCPITQCVEGFWFSSLVDIRNIARVIGIVRIFPTLRGFSIAPALRRSNGGMRRRCGPPRRWKFCGGVSSKGGKLKRIVLRFILIDVYNRDLWQGFLARPSFDCSLSFPLICIRVVSWKTW